ncbi:unnamed protein product, partial [Laminaria digitata]
TVRVCHAQSTGRVFYEYCRSVMRVYTNMFRNLLPRSPVTLSYHEQPQYLKVVRHAQRTVQVVCDTAILRVRHKYCTGIVYMSMFRNPLPRSPLTLSYRLQPGPSEAS